MQELCGETLGGIWTIPKEYSERCGRGKIRDDVLVRLISSSGFSPDAYKRKSQSEIAPKSTERGDQGLEVVPRYGVKCFKVRNI